MCKNKLPLDNNVKSISNLISVSYLIIQLVLSVDSNGGCNTRLLADRNLVPDSAFQHSSAVTLQHGASAARDDPNDPSLQERAWCPDAMVGRDLREFMEIDLGGQNFIKLIITKGRVAQSKGRQKTPYFYVKYRRELNGGKWFDYAKENGTRRLTGNQDAMTENFNAIDPPFVARFIRIYPFSLEPIKTCLKLQILGCKANGIVGYEAPMGTVLPKSILSTYSRTVNDEYTNEYISSEQLRLIDTTYDYLLSNQIDKFSLMNNVPMMDSHGQLMNYLRGGLGKLTDNDTELKSSTSPFSSHKYVGWRYLVNEGPSSMLSSSSSSSSSSSGKTMHSNNNNNNNNNYIRLLFNFDMIYQFNAISFYLANDFLIGLTMPKNISLRFAINYLGQYHQKPQSSDILPSTRTSGKSSSSILSISSIDYTLIPDKQNTDSRWISLPIIKSTDDLHGTVKSVKKQLNKEIINQYGIIMTNGDDDDERSDQIGIGIGSQIEMDIYFNSEWMAIGEVLFDNKQFTNLRINPTLHQSVSNSSTIITKHTDQESSRLKSDPSLDSMDQTNLADAFPNESVIILNQTTTYILAAVCGLLFILICSGLFCLVCVWSRRHKSCLWWSVGEKFFPSTHPHDTKGYHPDTDETRHHLHHYHHPQQQQQQYLGNHYPFSNALNGNYRLSTVERDCLFSKSIHTEICSTPVASAVTAMTSITSPSSASASSSISTTTATVDLYLMPTTSTNRSTVYTTPTTMNTTSAGVGIVTTTIHQDDVYQCATLPRPQTNNQYPNINNSNAFVPTQAFHQMFANNNNNNNNNHSDSLGTMNMNCNYSTTSSNLFIPIGLGGNQFTNNTNNLLSVMPNNFLSPNGPVLFDESPSYRPLAPGESSIYTTLPIESDCDSQPYAKVIDQNGSILRGSSTASTISTPINYFNELHNTTSPGLVIPTSTSTNTPAATIPTNSSSLTTQPLSTMQLCNMMTVGNFQPTTNLYNPILKRPSIPVNIPPPPSLPLPPTPEHNINTNDNDLDDDDDDDDGDCDEDEDVEEEDVIASNMNQSKQKLRQINQFVHQSSMQPYHYNQYQQQQQQQQSPFSAWLPLSIEGNCSGIGTTNMWLDPNLLLNSDHLNHHQLMSNMNFADQHQHQQHHPHTHHHLTMKNHNNGELIHNPNPSYNQMTFNCSTNLLNQTLPNIQTIQIKR